MTVNYLSPVAITLALLPRMVARGSGTIVNVSSLGGRLGIATEAAYSASKFALAGWSEVAGSPTWSAPASPCAWCCPGPSTPRSGTSPTTTRPIYAGPLVPAEEVADGIVACIDSDQFEHYLPDMRAVVEMKTKDFDGFVAGMRAMAEAPRRRRRERVMKALVFGARPDRPRSGRCRPTSWRSGWPPCPSASTRWTTPGPSTPTGWSPGPSSPGCAARTPSWSSGEFEDGDIDNPMAAFSSLPHVPGHEVVAEVVALGPEGPRRGGRPAGGAQPVADLRPARDRAPVPAVPGRRPQPVLVLHQG